PSRAFQGRGESNDAASTKHPRAVAAGPADRAAPGNAAAGAGHRRADAALARHDTVARADFAGWLAPNLGGADDRFEIGQRGVVVMRARRVEHDEIETTADHRADDAALAPQLVTVEMLVIELEAVRRTQERTRLQV